MQAEELDKAIEELLQLLDESKERCPDGEIDGFTKKQGGFMLS
jgi:hypothetical protein